MSEGGVDWKGAGEFATRHWPYFVVGGVALFGMFFLAKGTSTAATTAGGATTTQATALDTATLQAQVALATQSIVTQGQVTQAQIAADASVQQTAISASAAAYQTQTNDLAQTTQVLAAHASGQNVQMAQALASGFSNYILGTAQELSSATGAIASTAASNNSAAGSTIQRDLTGAAALVGAWSGGAFGALGGISAAALANGTGLPSYTYGGGGFGGIPLGAVQVVPTVVTAGSGNATFYRTPNTLLN